MVLPLEPIVPSGRETGDDAMSDTATLATSPEWKALQGHYEAVKGLHLRTLFADDPERSERFSLEAAGLFLDYSKNRITDETIRLLLDLARREESPSGGTRCSPARRSMSARDRAVLHVALRAERGERISRRRQGCRARGPRGARPDGGVLGSGALGRVEGPQRQTHPQHHQRRDRRLVSGPGDGVPRAAHVRRPLAYRSLCRQCRRRRFCQGDAGPRSA